MKLNEMERDILDRPGYYVAIVAYYDGDKSDDDLIMEGWAIAYKEAI